MCVNRESLTIASQRYVMKAMHAKRHGALTVRVGR